MDDARRPYVGGERPLDDDRVRRLVRDASDEARMRAEDVPRDYERVIDTTRRGDNAEPAEPGDEAPGRP